MAVGGGERGEEVWEGKQGVTDSRGERAAEPFVRGLRKLRVGGVDVIQEVSWERAAAIAKSACQQR